MRIAVVHNSVSAGDAPDAVDVLSQAEAVSEALRHLGHKPVRLTSSLNLASIQKGLLAIAPQLVFNLVESMEDTGRLIHLFPSMLDAMGLPYTGACAEALWLTSNKVLAKTLLENAGLPTPAWTAPESVYRPRLHHGESQKEIPRWIIKSVWEHASIGLDDESVVGPLDSPELEDLLRVRARKMGGPCFAEAYIDGREFNLSLLQRANEVEVLPPAEIRFENFEASQPKIVGYQAKWETDSYQYHHTPRTFDFEPTDEGLLSELRRLALDCWRLFGLKGYARVDFRVDAMRRPWILEVNANPCLSADAGFAAAIHRSNLTYSQAINFIITSCR
jgi:D-alanine-D-alanine ligase